MKSKKNLVLLGMMGSGKSTIAYIISKKKKLKLVDIDQIIEKESRALARAEARNLTKFTGEKQIQNFLQSKKELIHIQGIFSFGFVIIICILMQ